MRRFVWFRLYMCLLILPGLVLLVSLCKPANITSATRQISPISAKLVSGRSELNTLFAQLATAQGAAEVQQIQAKIWNVWMDSGQAEVNAWMEQGSKAVSDGEYTKAIAIFTKVTARMPGYVEGWNKRATAYYMNGNYNASMQDIFRTLSIEKRHFGALSGLASIYLANKDYKEALKVLEYMMLICPNQPGLQEQVHELYQRLKIMKA
jgi:tetratricopeptide (TPR) repeat protein